MQNLAKTKEVVSTIGNFVIDDMKELQTRLPGLSGAILASADGFNICSLGMESNSVGKGASLTSTMFSLTQAITETILDNAKKAMEDEKQEVLISLGNMQIVALQIKHPTLENLILLVAAQDTMVGLLLANVRLVVDKIEKKLLTLVNSQ